MRVLFLLVSGGILLSTPLFAQDVRQPGLVVVLKPGYTVIDSLTLEECLRGFVESDIATASYKQAIEDGKKTLLKTKIKHFIYGLGTGALITTVYIIARKQ
jgi:hypothetical protein